MGVPVPGFGDFDIIGLFPGISQRNLVPRLETHSSNAWLSCSCNVFTQSFTRVDNFGEISCCHLLLELDRSNDGNQTSVSFDRNTCFPITLISQPWMKQWRFYDCTASFTKKRGGMRFYSEAAAWRCKEQFVLHQPRRTLIPRILQWSESEAQRRWQPANGTRTNCEYDEKHFCCPISAEIFC